MARCIYCQEEKTKEQFGSVEHVIPQSFGRFKNNLTLKNKVCDSCNAYFGQHLDLHLARDSHEGRSRVSHGITRPENFRSSRQSRIVIRIAENPLRGMYVYPEYSPEAGTITVKPCAQIGFLISGSYEYFLLDDIPTGQQLESNGFDANQPRSIKAYGASFDKIQEKLEEKNIYIPNLHNENEQAPPNAQDKIMCSVEALVDTTIFRAFAKIAFNYLAYFHELEFLHHVSFDPIRRYIRYGEEPEYRLVESKQEAILGATSFSPYFDY